jgi:hypothetical protein
MLLVLSCSAWFWFSLTMSCIILALLILSCMVLVLPHSVTRNTKIRVHFKRGRVGWVNFFPSYLDAIFKRTRAINPHRPLCLFARGTKGTPLLWNNEIWFIAFSFCEIRDQLYLPF